MSGSKRDDYSNVVFLFFLLKNQTNSNLVVYEMLWFLECEAEHNLRAEKRR